MDTLITAEVLLNVFHIQMVLRGENVVKGGTGFVVQSEGNRWFVTGAHVVDYWKVRDEGATVWIHGNGRNAERVELRTKAWGKKEDIGVYKVPECIGSEAEGLEIGERTEWVLGQKVQWLGYPLGLGGGMALGEPGREIGIVGTGHIASVLLPEQLRLGRASSGWLVDGPSNPGFSGSPVLFQRKDRKGSSVLGLIQGSVQAPHNYNLTIVRDIKRIVEMVNQWKREGIDPVKGTE